MTAGYAHLYGCPDMLGTGQRLTADVTYWPSTAAAPEVVRTDAIQVLARAIMLLAESATAEPSAHIDHVKGVAGILASLPPTEKEI